MSTSAPALEGLRASRPFPEPTGPTGSLIYRLITTTDHKVIGIMSAIHHSRTRPDGGGAGGAHVWAPAAAILTTPPLLPFIVIGATGTKRPSFATSGMSAENRIIIDCG